MSGGGDYLRLRKEELAAARTGATVKPADAPKPAMDLSKLKPTPAALPPPEVEAAAAVGRKVLADVLS